MTARKVAKARKVVKPRKMSKAPLYILIIVVIIIFSLLGVGLYYSLGTVNSNLLLMVIVIIGATILIEFIMKRDLYFPRREEVDVSETDDSKENPPTSNQAQEPEGKGKKT
jgi:fucose 4-O-acetylase-like acetyltransferase